MMTALRFAAAACLAAACSDSATSKGDADTSATLPLGATVGRMGYWSIATAPESPPGPPRGLGPKSDLTYYARVAGVSNAEARKRLEQQEKTRPEFERLMRTVRTKERGNYTDAELIHRPDWAYLIFFKRQPAATLAKYTKNPRFKARSAPYTQAELVKLTKPWIDRLAAERLFTGYGMNARHGTADIDMVVSDAEFAAIAARKGWEKPPAILNLKFTQAPDGAAIAPGLGKGIRVFAQSDRNLGLTPQMAIGGKIILRDGCFVAIDHDGKEQLAYFAREVGLGVDRQGYLSLHRRDGERAHLGRIGEHFTWAGPIGIDENAPMVRQLRAQCGKAPLMHVGVPDSTSMFMARYGLPRGPREPLVKPGEVPDAPPPAPKPPKRPG